MNYLFLILGILLVAASGVVIYFTVENNKDDPDTLQIILYSVSALMGLIVSLKKLLILFLILKKLEVKKLKEIKPKEKKVKKVKKVTNSGEESNRGSYCGSH